ncbi:MAG: SnoaL-like domain-containing protein [Gemmatimonadales bacterium]|nr:SnoaL-like domain-containing protein [Gemmatimonadales bacterium]
MIATTRAGPIQLAVTLMLLGACQSGTAYPPGSDAALADTLKGRIAEGYDFTRPGAAERMSDLYPDTGQVVSASGGNIIASADSLRAGIATFWQSVGQNMRNPKWVWGDVYVERLGNDAAVLTGTWSIPHIAPTGQPHVIQGAWTAVFRRIGGRWMIVAEHLSSPPSGR